MSKIKEAMEISDAVEKKVRKLSPLQALAWASTMLFLALITIGALLFLDGRTERDKDRGQMNQLIEQIVLLNEQIVVLNEQNGDLIRDQVEARLVKVCVKEKYDIAEEQGRETKGIIGKVFQENQIQFPNDLNLSFMKYDVKRGGIKDCLIFPDKN